jgi:transposase
MRDPATRPNGKLLETLKQHALKLKAKDDALAIKDDIIKQLEQKNKDLELAYNKLWRERFEARSERYIRDPDQLCLDFGDTADAADAAAGLADAVEEADLIPAHQRRKPRKKRDEGLPEHLPRYEVTAAVADEVKHCEAHGERTLLPEEMWDKTETLEFEPPVLKVRVTKHPKYACPTAPQCGIVSPERPIGIVEGNKYDASIAAEIIADKFSYHMPIYRQQDYFAGSGWAPGRSTLINILAGSFFVIQPLLEYFKRTVQNDSVFGCDDTGVTLLYP